jgi:hypothetical protein
MVRGPQRAEALVTTIKDEHAQLVPLTLEDMSNAVASIDSMLYFIGDGGSDGESLRATLQHLNQLLDEMDWVR